MKKMFFLALVTTVFMVSASYPAQPEDPAVEIKNPCRLMYGWMENAPEDAFIAGSFPLLDKEIEIGAKKYTINQDGIDALVINLLPSAADNWMRDFDKRMDIVFWLLQYQDTRNMLVQAYIDYFNTDAEDSDERKSDIIRVNALLKKQGITVPGWNSMIASQSLHGVSTGKTLVSQRFEEFSKEKNALDKHMPGYVKRSSVYADFLTKILFTPTASDQSTFIVNNKVPLVSLGELIQPIIRKKKIIQNLRSYGLGAFTFLALLEGARRLHKFFYVVPHNVINEDNQL